MRDEVAIWGLTIDMKDLATEIVLAFVLLVGVCLRKSFSKALRMGYLWLKRFGYRYKVPPLYTNARFVGREQELKQLRKHLMAGEIPLIHAEGGMGKSELALEYARRNMKYYTGGVFSVPMDKVSDWDAAVRRMYKEYGEYLDGTNRKIENGGVAKNDDRDSDRQLDVARMITRVDASDQEVTANEIRAIFVERLRRGKVLLIFDNMERSSLFLLHANNAKKGLPALFGADVPENCHIIVTSQRVDGFSPSERVKPIGLSRLSAAESAELINKICPPRSEGDQDAVTEIAEFLEGHPLSIELVASDVSSNYDRGVTYAKKLTSMRQNFDLIGQGGDSFNHGEVVPRLVLRPIIDSLVKNEGENALRLAQIVSLFPVEGVQWHVLLNLWRQLISPEDSSADGFARMIAVLQQYSLIKINGGLFERSVFDAELVSMHRYTREAILQDLIDKKQRGRLIGRIAIALVQYAGFGLEDWVSLAGRSLLFTKCPFDKFGGIEWVALLNSHPEYATKCDFALLDGMQFSNLLVGQPQFEKECRFAEFTGENWATLLSKSPGYESKCSWESLSYFDWCELLRHQPRFANRCPWPYIPSFILVDLCFARPFLVLRHARFVVWLKTVAGVFIDFFAEKFKSMKVFIKSDKWPRIDGRRLGRIVYENPTLENRCDWNMLNGTQWSQLLRAYPQFANYCQWGKLDGADWALLLSERPQFAEKCDWGKFNGACWVRLLIPQPQFSEKVQWKDLKGPDWARLMAMRPVFCDKCTWENLGKRDWVFLLAMSSRFSKEVAFANFSGQGWALMIQMAPFYASLCDWSQLDGQTWVILLSYDPRYADKCDWGKLDRAEREVLFRKQPQLRKIFEKWVVKA